eukprot:2430838-Rhodomonas_salina.1
MRSRRRRGVLRPVRVAAWQRQRLAAHVTCGGWTPLGWDSGGHPLGLAPGWRGRLGRDGRVLMWCVRHGFIGDFQPLGRVRA